MSCYPPTGVCEHPCGADKRTLMDRDQPRPACLLCSAESPYQLEPCYLTAAEARAHALRFRQQPGQALRALEAFRQAAELGSDAVNAVEYAEFLLQLDRLAEASASFARALELDPGNADLHYKKGVIDQQRGDVASAVKSFEKSLMHNPAQVGALFNLGVVHKGAENWREAEAFFKRVLEVDPSNKEVVCLIAECAACQGEDARAIEILEKAVLKDHRNYALQRQLRELRQMRRNLPQSQIDPRQMVVTC